MNNIKSWLDKQIADEQHPSGSPLVVKVRHDVEKLNTLTKKEIVAYAKANGIAINSRKKREELIDIIVRN
jgi:hypothetical protein